MTRGTTKGVGRAVVVRLYIAGDGPNAISARRNLDAFLAEYPDCEVDLEVIDVLRNPERGLADGVLVTPLLVKVAPSPERRVIGNLQVRTALVAGLGFGECR
jgi:circadian clock protein KaiB